MSTDHTFNFALNEYTINDKMKSELLKFINILKDNPSINLYIESHSDNTSSPSNDMMNSERRGMFVKGFFIDNGIDASRIKVVALGAKKPIASNNTEKGRFQNRRVELYFK